MYQQNKGAFYLTVIACMLAFCVIMLGAYTRLKDAGLGCPDWPGCYGQIVAPDTPHRIQQANQSFPAQTIDQKKAWTEMIHRYAAGTLGLLIIIAAFRTLRHFRLPGQPKILPVLLILLVIFQALLGMWTVTLKLYPAVVMLHLMCGMLVLSLLWLLALRLKDAFSNQLKENITALKFWAVLGFIVVFAQIFLGGWTSSNYAALVCPDFPYCHEDKLWPATNFSEAFHLFRSIGPNYFGGVLDYGTRVTIHMTHRLGALITAIYLLILSACLLTKQAKVLKRIAMVIIFLLLLQIGLGIANVVYMLPVGIAVAHNGVAALLLVTLMTLIYAVFKISKKYLYV